MIGASSRYRVVRRLGQGGMAEVFEAELLGELDFVRKVAIKQLLPAALSDPVAAQRFVDETRIASQLHHANIVAVLDVGLLDDRPFQVLELVDGLDAQDLVRRAGGALPADLALTLALAVAHALDHAHAATGADGRPLGIVHRDVKPANILVAWSGDVKLADFGIAVAHDRVAHTEAGVVAGTRGFLAPEQRMRGAFDGRSDVFALGLTLHALCTGATPLSDLAAEARLLAGEPLALDPALPDDVRALIARAVAPERRDRPTADALASAIGHALATRGARDARAVVRDFLAAFRAPVRRAGALDLLLGVDLVPIGEPGAVQRYATEAARQIGEPPVLAMPQDRPAPSAAPPRDPTAPTVAHRRRPPPPGRRRARLIAATLVAIAAITATAAITEFRRPAPQPAPAGSSAIAIATPATGPAATAPPDITPPDTAASPRTTTPPDPAASPRSTAGAPILSHVARLPGHHVTSPPAAASGAPSPPVSSEHGYVQIVGEDLLRARVLIDGVAVGYVPNRFAVALGHHRVEVERPDGVRLPPRDVDVTSFHTAQRPARPTW
jgi:tRNA A-37 threonylcarbamoyl transferase component Bud32